MGIVVDKILGDVLMHDHWSPTIPATPTSSGTKGDEAFDSTHYYKAIDTDTWKRVAWDSWVSATIEAGNPMGLLLTLTYSATP